MLPSLKGLLETNVMSMFSAKRQLLGLDIGSSAIKVIQMKEQRGRYVLQKFAVKELEPEVIVDGTVMDEGRVVSAIKELMEDTKIKIKTPLGSVPLNVTVPVDVQVPVDLVVDIPINETIPIKDEFPVKLDVPISINVRETELASLTDSLAAGLRSLQDVINGLG